MLPAVIADIQYKVAVLMPQEMGQCQAINALVHFLKIYFCSIKNK
jgi:hypothetical protein